jgi:curved DNA-binding protein
LDQMSDLYAVLGVAKDADQVAIKKAYKKLAQKYHPDRYEGDDATTKFQEINAAYQTLSDPDKRAAYDNPAPEGYSRQQTYSSHEEMVQAAMDNLMRQRGGGFNRQQSYPMARVTITLEEAFTGTSRELTVDGKTSTIDIPAGTRSGNQLFVEGLIIVITIMRHHKFQRANDDIATAVQISAIEAMVGIECCLTNIDGKVIKVKIPAGIQHGKLVRAAGMGMPNPEIDKRGDLLVQVAITTPTDLTDDEKASIMKIKHRKSFDA